MVVVSTVVVLVQPTFQVDAVTTAKRNLSENTPGNEFCEPLNMSEKSLVIIANLPYTDRLFDPYVQLLFLVSLEQLLYSLSE